jgi:FAD binding domain/Berberine and berberine like
VGGFEMSGASTQSRFAGLRQQLLGELVLPEDAAYDSVRRLWNGLFDRRPEAIARCRDTSDVVAALRFAREAQIPVSVRGGGHGVSGSAAVDHGLMIDLSLMRAVSVDPVRQTVWVQGGATWGGVDHASQLFGLAVPGGFVSTTGVGGFTLGGGIAWTSRGLGLACDALEEVEVVLADGRVVRASSSSHPDLFWALRGGGGNFGIATSFLFRGQRVGPTVYGGFRVFPVDRARSVLRLVADLYSKTPPEFNALVGLTTIPPAPMFPPELHGRKVAIAACCFLGKIEDGPTVARELLDLPGAVVDHVGPLPYLTLQTAFDAGQPAGDMNYWKSTYAASLPEQAIEVLLERFERVTSPATELHFQYFGGAASRISAEDSAIGNRSAPFLFNLIGKWKDPRENDLHIRYIRDLWDALQPFATGGVYANFLTDQTLELTRASFGAENHARLARVKREFDPDNIFRGSHNILPAP